jgi:hypothetical protein
VKLGIDCGDGDGGGSGRTGADDGCVEGGGEPLGGDAAAGRAAVEAAAGVGGGAGAGAGCGAAAAGCAPLPGSFTIPWHLGHLSMKGVDGTLASSTIKRLEQFGQLVCTSYLSIKLSISLSVAGTAAPFASFVSALPAASIESFSFKLGALVA